MKSVLIISIGPVQDFIASARRSGDLWFGSWLLSELSKAAAKGVAQAEGVSALVFPSPKDIEELEPEFDSEKSLNVANKIVAVVPAMEVGTIAGRAKELAQERLTELAREAFKKVGRFEDEDIAFRQINDLLEFTWASAEFDSPDQYKVAREKVERVLAARKSLRDFAPVTWGSSKPKSSLDGARESVLPKLKKTEGEETRYKKFGTRKEEQLCGVGLMKRNGQRRRNDEAGRVCSTSHFAALPLLARIADTPANKAHASTFFQILRDLKLDNFFGETPFGVMHPVFGDKDARLLFEERYVEFFEESKEDKKTEKSKAVNALRDFLKAVTGGKRPSAYYGLIHADGDRMGAAIDHCGTPDAHRELSRALAKFADDVSNIVKRHDGSLVYAGGDDVLAYVPLHTALACAKELAESFKTRLDGFPTKEDEKPTLSVGLAVSHHLDSLSDALDRARRAEKVAKKVEGKNAFAVIFDKRGGAETTVSGKWGDFDTRLGALIDLYGAGALPHGVAYELRGMSLRLDEATASAEFREGIRAEARRILKRKRDGGGDKLKPELIAEILETRPIFELADELIVAREFDRVMRLADAARGDKGGSK
jgi:CRISPR-associated protein Cmr2